MTPIMAHPGMNQASPGLNFGFDLDYLGPAWAPASEKRRSYFADALLGVPQRYPSPPTVVISGFPSRVPSLLRRRAM